MANEVNQLRLLFEKSEGKYKVRLHPSGGGDAPEAVPFEPFLTEEDYEDLRWYLEDYLDLPDGGSVVRAQRVERSLEDWGRKLFQQVFDIGDHRELLIAFKEGSRPRLLTLATNDTELLQLPWELMADTRGPLTRQHITIRRQLETAGTPTEYEVGLPLRILLVVSRPDDLGFIDPRHTTRGMLEALSVLGKNVVVDFCRPPTLAAMERTLSEAERRGEPYHIFHFDGHGTFLPEIGLGAVCFEKPVTDEGGGKVETDYVRADRLGNLLARYNIPLAILEACRSGQIGHVAAFRSVAPRLIEAGVGSVLSMSHSVHIEATRILLERFYAEVVSGLTIGQALEEGRAALMAYPFRWIERGAHGRSIELKDWFLPHLYQRGKDLNLVPSSQAVPDSGLLAQIHDPDREIHFDVFLSHQHAESDRVERIAERLRDDFGLRVFLDKWLIKSGEIFDQCEQAVQLSRFVLVACSRQSLESDWVNAELGMARAIDPRGRNIIPLLMEEVALPPGLAALRCYDFRDPDEDAERIAELAQAIKTVPTVSSDLRLVVPPSGGSSSKAPEKEPPEGGTTSRDRGAPAMGEEVGAFPRPPVYQFHGRAPELYALEREFRAFRAILLHAMGGMGKTSLAREAAFWWTRTGLFPDGACFISFERGGGADKIALILGTYLEGHAFEALQAEEQIRRAGELFQQKKVLMVWDNFESVLPAFQNDEETPVVSDEERGRILELFRDWTASPEGQGRLLITCRPAEAGLEGARRMELHGLARPDSFSLLARVMKTHGVELSDPRLSKEKLSDLLKALSDHPLSIELVGPHLKTMKPEEIVADFGALLAGFKTGAGRERNESLLASLAFSTRRLSKKAQEALPWLGLFSGGVFEQILLDVSQLKPEEWELVRAELEATALVRVERDILLADRPYLRFHPTLGYAAKGEEGVGVWEDGSVGGEEGGSGGGWEYGGVGEEEIRKRFVGVYYAVGAAIGKALRGSQGRAGMEMMAREEANFRCAVQWAIKDAAYSEASAMGDTFAIYLQMSGRLRERDSWVKWLAGEVGKSGFTNESAAYQREEAWSLFTQGQAQEAVEKLQALIERLKHTTEFDPAFQLAITQGILARVYLTAGLSAQAIPILEEAAGQWEALAKKEGDAGKSSDSERGNLSAALGDLANALGSAGQLDEAMEAAERATQINRDLGRQREVATGIGMTAQILMEQGRYQDADQRYDEALGAARRAGDRELEGSLLQNQGSLADHMRQYGRAADLYQRALKLFQEANKEDSVMRTCNLLGVVERKSGRLSEARVWYERSREIAARRGDKDSLGNAAQNIGIVCQQEGEAARADGDEAKAQEQFREAERFLQRSLRLKVEIGNRPLEVTARSQLAQIYLLLGELDKAEEHARQALEIREGLGLKEVFRDYNNLADIARARRNESEAAEWERKRDEVLEELERRAQGGGSGLPAQVLQGIQALAIACAQAGVDESDLDPQIEAALSQLDQAPAPLDALAPFLRSLAAGQAPSVPSALPGELRQMLEALLEAVREARQG